MRGNAQEPSRFTTEAASSKTQSRRVAESQSRRATTQDQMGMNSRCAKRGSGPVAPAYALCAAAVSPTCSSSGHIADFLSYAFSMLRPYSTVHTRSRTVRLFFLLAQQRHVREEHHLTSAKRHGEGKAAGATHCWRKCSANKVAALLPPPPSDIGRSLKTYTQQLPGC